MPQVKCPSCATIVTYATGHSPVCPDCGFREPAPIQPGAPGVTPVFSPLPDGQVPANNAPENGMAIAALVCGVAGFMVFFTGPVAVILGIVALNQRVDGAGRGMAIAGIVLGSLVTIGAILLFVFIFSMMGAA